MRASLPTHDSIQEFQGARHDRMWDGMTLWLEGHTDSAAGAVYLLGYCVEMALKCAYFRVLGLQISDPITALELRAAQAKAVATLDRVLKAVEWFDLNYSRLYSP